MSLETHKILGGLANPWSTDRVLVGMAQTAPGLGKSPTNEAVARSGPATAKSARAKVYAIAPMDLWATIKLGHGSAYAAEQA